MKMPEYKPAENENGRYNSFDESPYYSENVEAQNVIVNNTINYDNSQQDNDFSEYMWMEHMEEFDREVMKRLEEEALMEECMEAMLEDERTNTAPPANTGANNAAKLQVAEVTAQTSKLNPLAAEFVPSNLTGDRSKLN